MEGNGTPDKSQIKLAFQVFFASALASVERINSTDHRPGYGRRDDSENLQMPITNRRPHGGGGESLE